VEADDPDERKSKCIRSPKNEENTEVGASLTANVTEKGDWDGDCVKQKV
jgi:hypothetical protein